MEPLVSLMLTMLHQYSVLHYHSLQSIGYLGSCRHLVSTLSPTHCNNFGAGMLGLG